MFRLELHFPILASDAHGLMPGSHADENDQLLLLAVA